MARPHTDSSKRKICETALSLAAKKGWRPLTLDQIAETAKIPPAQIHKMYASKNDLLPEIVSWIDGCAAMAAATVNPSDPPRDRLFEILMARFDILQKHRGGVLAILKDGRRDPAFLRHMMPAHIKIMRQIVASAHLAPSEGGGTLVTCGLLAVYYRTVWEWEKDLSSDMTKTMATLDKSLKCAAKAAGILLRRSK